MKKDAVYSMRMNSRVREALKAAARKERRTVASLLDKIIIEYLSQEGHINLDAERRNHRRTRITLPARSIVSEGSQKKSFPGVVLDLSMGGVLLTYAKGSDIPFSSVGKLPRFELCLEDPRSPGICHPARPPTRRGKHYTPQAFSPRRFAPAPKGNATQTREGPPRRISDDADPAGSLPVPDSLPRPPAGRATYRLRRGVAWPAAHWTVLVPHSEPPAFSA